MVFFFSSDWNLNDDILEKNVEINLVMISSIKLPPSGGKRYCRDTEHECKSLV